MKVVMNKRIKIFVVTLLLSGCASFGISKYTQIYGLAKPVNRVVAQTTSDEVDYWRDIKPILDNRCVVCHACYDAPCQLKLTAIEGIERGASHDSVYHLSRPFPAEPSRLFVDAQSIEQWRSKGFFPVLNEHQQTVMANVNAGVMYQTLSLKQKNPLPTTALLPDSFTLGTDRKNHCPKIDDFEKYAEKKPLWGMPYGLPAITSGENKLLMAWLAQGATYTARPEMPKSTARKVLKWERFLNQASPKSQLMSRYLYEHLFLASLYFDDEDGSDTQFFNVVRSRTPSGQAVDIIATRRPYDDPRVEEFYYRLIPALETPVLKTHMPYGLNNNRMDKWKTWFLEEQYSVEKLPSYLPEEAGNPFLTFAAIPSKSRYRFLLDEAQFTIGNFIKGPVCRGQVAVNVIRDHFWVVFVDPDVSEIKGYDSFLAENYQDFKMPNTEGNVYLPMTTWGKYADKQLAYLEKRDKFLSEIAPELVKRDMKLIWDGDGQNPNAGLTIYRHFDNASVEKGLLGGQPKTAWLIGYGLLERIYYLLAAGYDVYGNVGHQFLSRVYMDFLRMEGETNFLYFLPQESRIKEREDWYQGAEDRAHRYLRFPSLEELNTPVIPYQTTTPKAELLRKIEARVKPAIDSGKTLLVADVDSGPLASLKEWRGEAIAILPEFSIVEVTSAGGSDYYSLLKNSGHKNVSSMFNEKANLAPNENNLSVLKGIAGSYPNAFYRVEEGAVDAFSLQLSRVKSELDYKVLKDQYGVRRTSKDFWDYSDRLHANYKARAPIDAAILDFNRLENR